MKRTSSYLLFAFFALSLAMSCKSRSHYETDRDGDANTETAYNNDDDSRSLREQERDEDLSIRKGTKVHMEHVGGVYYVPIIVDGVSLKFIFDTGASSISISSAEAAVLYKQGMLAQEDVKGSQQFVDATGNVSVGAVINLRTVTIGDITLHNVEASVVDNIQAPLLLGQTALSKFGKISIDYDNNIIEFN